jgi:putative nucleotidyltransferase with HDIG domain
MMSERSGSRWRGRPLLSGLLRTFVFLAPIGAALGASLLVGRLMIHTAAPARWMTAFGASTLALIASDRAVRRLLPLVVLLRLSLAFPGEAPSRLRVARGAAGLRTLEDQARRARDIGADEAPDRAARRILELVASLEAHDRATRGHSERVRLYVDLIAEELRLPDTARDRLRWAALLHDVGKLRVSSEVLNKPARLSAEEREHVERHPAEGAELITPLRSWLGEFAAVVEQHHERFDGTGYPGRLSGNSISLGARITAVADTYETITAARPYRKPVSPAKAREEIVRCAGSQFDPTVVRAFLQISVRRRRFASGPLAWLLEMPLLQALQEAASRVVTAAAAAGGAAVMALMPAPISPALAGPLIPPEPPHPPAVSSSAAQPSLDLGSVRLVASRSGSRITTLATKATTSTSTSTSTKRATSTKKKTSSKKSHGRKSHGSKLSGDRTIASVSLKPLPPGHLRKLAR